MRNERTGDRSWSTSASILHLFGFSRYSLDPDGTHKPRVTRSIGSPPPNKSTPLSTPHFDHNFFRLQRGCGFGSRDARVSRFIVLRHPLSISFREEVGIDIHRHLEGGVP